MLNSLYVFWPVLYEVIWSLQSFTFMSATVVMFQPSWIFFICIHNVCVGLLCDLCFNSRGVCTDLDVCFVPWWNMPSVRAPNMHILNLLDVNYSYHTHVHRIVHSLQKWPRINGALFLLRQFVLCLFIIRAAGFTDRKRSSLTPCQQNNSVGVTWIIQSLIILLSLNYLCSELRVLLIFFFF